MAETKINANQTNITADDIGALSASNESTATVGQVLTKTATGAEWDDAQGGGSSYTAGTGIAITNDVISVTAPTLQNTATNTAKYLSIFGSYGGPGVEICGGVGSSNVGGIAIGGDTSNYKADASGFYGAIAIGRSAVSSGAGTVAIGRDAKAYSDTSIAIGYVAKVEGASYAIQLGYGTNTTANTFSVGLGQNNNYQLLASDGKIGRASCRERV